MKDQNHEKCRRQNGASPNADVSIRETVTGSGSARQAPAESLWRIRRLHRGSGKARWHTIATGLTEYLAKTWVNDSNAGTRNWRYIAEVERPNDKAQERRATDS
jgi:hypothetical protein